jgi:hypothetical protein
MSVKEEDNWLILQLLALTIPNSLLSRKALVFLAVALPTGTLQEHITVFGK